MQKNFGLRMRPGMLANRQIIGKTLESWSRVHQRTCGGSAVCDKVCGSDRSPVLRDDSIKTCPFHQLTTWQEQTVVQERIDLKTAALRSSWFDILFSCVIEIPCRWNSCWAVYNRNSSSFLSWDLKILCWGVRVRCRSSSPYLSS